MDVQPQCGNQRHQDTRLPGNAPVGRALIVDPDPMDANALSCMLMGVCTDIWTAATGFEALRCLQCAMSHGNPFDLVTLAWSLPGMDGVQTARRIRDNPRLIRQPVILMITAQCRAQDLFHFASREWRRNHNPAPGQTSGQTPGHTPPHDQSHVQASTSRPLKPDKLPAPPRDAFLLKPVQMEVLQDTVRHVLGVR